MNLPLISSGMINFILAFLGALAAVGLTLYACYYKFKDTRTRKRRIIFILSLAGLVVAYLLFYTVSCMVGRYQAGKQLAMMQADGVPRSLNDIKPAMPAKDSDNGIQYYEAAQKLIKCSSFETLTDRYMENPNKHLPYKSYDLATWDKADQQAAISMLSNKEIDMILDLFHQGAQKQVAVYDRDYRKGFATLLPELGGHRALFRLLYMKSSACGLEGKPAAGYALIQDGFRTLKQFETDPCIISQLVNIACCTINIDAMNSLLARYGIDEQTARQLMDRLSQLDFNRGMLHALSCEVIMVSDLFEGIITSRNDLRGVLLDTDLEQIKLAASGPFIYWDYNYYLTNMQKVRTLFRQPYWQNTATINDMRGLGIASIPHRYPVSRNLFPALPTVLLKVARINSEIIGARLSLALYIYKNQHGAFPDKLESLAPAIIKEIPVDPINGKPFEYRRNGSSFVLSSAWLKEKAEMGRNGLISRRAKGILK